MEISHKRLDFWLRLAVRMSWELGALTSTQSHGSGLAAHLSGGADPAWPPQPAPRLRPPAAARTTERRRLSGTLGSCLPSPCGQLGFVTSDDRTRSVSHGARRWRVSHYPPGPCSFSPDTAVLLRTRPPSLREAHAATREGVPAAPWQSAAAGTGRRLACLR